MASPEVLPVSNDEFNAHLEALDPAQKRMTAEQLSALRSDLDQDRFNQEQIAQLSAAVRTYAQSQREYLTSQHINESLDSLALRFGELEQANLGTGETVGRTSGAVAGEFVGRHTEHLVRGAIGMPGNFVDIFRNENSRRKQEGVDWMRYTGITAVLAAMVAGSAILLKKSKGKFRKFLSIIGIIGLSSFIVNKLGDSARAETASRTAGASQEDLERMQKVVRRVESATTGAGADSIDYSGTPELNDVDLHLLSLPLAVNGKKVSIVRAGGASRIGIDGKAYTLSLSNEKVSTVRRFQNSFRLTTSGSTHVFLNNESFNAMIDGLGNKADNEREGDISLQVFQGDTNNSAQPGNAGTTSAMNFRFERVG